MEILSFIGLLAVGYIIFGGGSYDDYYFDEYMNDDNDDENLNDDELSFSKDYIMDDEIDFNTW